jgi:hypothetical protein
MKIHEESFLLMSLYLDLPVERTLELKKKCCKKFKKGKRCKKCPGQKLCGVEEFFA